MVLAMVVAFLASYFLGNINGAVSMSALLAQDDVRKHGSGNAGLTNFIRIFGRAQAVYVVIIDMSKAVLSCLLGGMLLEPYGLRMEGAMLAAVAVSLGHDFPAILGFKGGKGILCGVSIAAVLDWRCALIILGVFLIFFLATRYVSLGSVMGALAFVISFAVFHYTNIWVIAGAVFIGGLAIFMHRGNIQRLLQGTERKSSLFGKKI